MAQNESVKPAAWMAVRDFLFSPPRNERAFLTGIILFAFALRVAVMFATHSYRVIDYGDDRFSFGWEMGRVARSLAEGNGFSSPLPLPTGPTAIVGPVFPLILAGVFKLFGVYTTGSAIAIRLLQCVFASLTCLFVYLCGRDVAGGPTGKLAALIWAVFPLNIFFTVTKVWETSLTAMLTAALFWYMFSIRDSVSPARWALAGALFGFAALLNTSLVMLGVPFGVYALVRNRWRMLLPALAGGLACTAVISPWMLRNHQQFGAFILRSNFPLEFRVCNNEISPGEKVEDMHPAKTPHINRHWQDLGEIGFMREERALNARYLASEKGLFAFSIVNRVVNYWSGVWIVPTEDFPNDWRVSLGISTLSLIGFLGIRRMFYAGNSTAFLFAGCLFMYPLVYYLTTSQPRFYHAITPLLVVASAYWLVGWQAKFAAKT